VDLCAEPECARPSGGPRTFFLGGPPFCAHLTALYGTAIPGLAGHIRDDHDGPDCQCISRRWWPAAEISRAEAAAARATSRRNAGD
jgi:hypothetical protein